MRRCGCDCFATKERTERGCFPAGIKEDATLQILVGLIGVIYFLVIIGLAFYGLHNLFTTILYLRMKTSIIHGEIAHPLKKWPRVTIQLPIFNEKYTVERLLQAVTELDYPADCFQIQVLDDSSDDTLDLVCKLVEEYQSHG